MNNVQTPPCFPMLSLTKPNTDLRSGYVISGRHLLSTQKSSSRSRVQGCSGRSFSPSPLLSADSGLTVSLCFFMIMILSCVHKHTSPKCFPSCAWNRFHPRLICFFPLSFTFFSCSTTAWKMFAVNTLKKRR